LSSIRIADYKQKPCERESARASEQVGEQVMQGSENTLQHTAAHYNTLHSTRAVFV